ncbi:MULTISPECIES: TVP38/TMEM64 family protein [Aerococcus]|uniref:TVP38/TMEM64 family membrane protein n=1 Tax=Aerococcus sanguinicola TaxID=119206 RepID=A0A5N1GN14_9LACT|nr:MULTISPECIES: VTT domain-containing protein [Aerococcus]KAA9302182.1 TVP38/TMEM64 family protein [Aerococcus sanguinicola]MDK6368388.1 VTT domain-containing protein [Aerococcus sp. UMB9870]MDK6679470.1 VTT domain-containing protein [Aerococcus sp. UMB8608]MDK6687237.1 VTT domain-containing protein [Aerococcus sp. UMB8623]MDK6941065.1 VTT domain-containing protein [Aerococcus sp. UMB8487]
MDEVKNKVNWSKWGRSLALVVIFLLSWWIFKTFNLDRVRELVMTSSYAEVIYVLLWTFLPMGFFPVPVLALAGGMGFGLWKGSLLTVLGASFNMSFMFLMARYLFRRPVQNFLFERYPSTRDILSTKQRRLRIVLALARLIPLVPYNIENYAFGLTDIRFIDYLGISLITILPGTLIYVNVGDKAVAPKTWDFVLAIGLLLLLVIGTAFLTKYMREPED